MAFVYAWMVPLWAAQLLPQLLIEQFDTLRIQCRHIEHMHEGVCNFCLAQILLKSSFQNLGLLVLTITCQVFSLNLTVRGVSNKHCLLTFFIVAPFVCEGSVFGPCFVMQYLVSFLVCCYLNEKERTGCFTFIFFLTSSLWCCRLVCNV